jgi:hypothetical protein
LQIDAGKSKIVEVVSTAVYPWNDVFDVKGGHGRIILMQTTILASVSRAFANLGSGLRSNHLGLRVGEVLRLPFENGDKLVRAHVSCVLSTLFLSEFAFS